MKTDDLFKVREEEIHEVRFIVVVHRNEEYVVQLFEELHMCLLGAH